MELKIKVKDLDYDSLIRAVIPILKETAESSDSNGLKFIANILRLPGELPLKMLSALSQEKKDEIVVYLVNHYKEKIVEWVQDSLKEKGFSIEIDDIEITKEGD